MGLDLHVKLFLKIIAIQRSCQPHLPTIGQIKKVIAFLRQSFLHPCNYQATSFVTPNPLIDLSEIFVIERQAVSLHLDQSNDFPKQIQGTDAIDSIFSKCDKLLYDLRWTVLEVLKGNGAEDGFQSSCFVFRDSKEVIFLGELLFKTDSFVRVVGSHKQVAHISNLFLQESQPSSPNGQLLKLGLECDLACQAWIFFGEILFIFSVVSKMDIHIK